MHTLFTFEKRFTKNPNLNKHNLLLFLSSNREASSSYHAILFLKTNQALWCAEEEQ
jgi:hypothetical protein